MDQVNIHFNEWLNMITTYLEEDNQVLLFQYLSNLHAADISQLLVEFEEDQQAIIFSLLPEETAALVLEEVTPDLFSDLLKSLNREGKISILELMPQDEIADKLGELSDERRHEIIEYLDVEDAVDVKELLVYSEDTAGGLMTKEFVTLNENYSIYYAIETLRATAPEAETIYYVYVIDEKGKLTGVISLRELIVSKPNVLIRDIMNRKTISVNVQADQEEVAQIVAKYDLLALPVVDVDDRIVGIITVDDVIDVIEEEATEDFYKFAGSSENEVYDEDDNLATRIKNSVRSRLPWLIVTVFGGLLSASIISKFQGTLEANATLALFMPLLAGMGGNVGTQSSTITVRSIAMGQIRGNDVFKVLFHEIAVGFLVGLVCSTLVAISAYFLKSEMLISLIVGVAMWANIATASLIGTVVPLVFKKMNIDPAVASAPFITTTVDITGLTIYFSLATVLMANFL